MRRFLPSLIFLFLLSIISANAAGTINIVNPEIKVDEGSGTVSIFLEKSKSDFRSSSVEYRIISSSATIGLDYLMQGDGVIQWGDEDASNKQIDIELLNDLDEETDEKIIIELFNPSAGVYLGDSTKATITIIGSESGSLGFAIDEYIGSENDGEIRVMVSRRDGLEGAILVDYDIRELTELDESVIPSLPHYRRLPEQQTDSLQMTEVKGVKAKANTDFIASKGTLLFLDYQSSAIIPVIVRPNLDGNAYPHTVLEVVLDNPRPLLSLDQLDNVDPHQEDLATIKYISKVKSNPNIFKPERETLTPSIDIDRRIASVRINDISGPALSQKIWEENIAPDVLPRVGFRFGQARYYASEGDRFRVPVFRSAPFDREVSVRYMVGPNRGFLVDDPRENWQNENPKENPLTDSLQNFERIMRGDGGNPNQAPYSSTEDQSYFDPPEDIYYAAQPGDEPRITPDSLYGTGNFYSSAWYKGVFGDPNQLMHYDLDYAILNPGSDVPTPTGARDTSPSFHKPLSPNEINK